ncbi:hypothetical protein IPM65_02705 [Candidatus Roizmanbacteria bacterium]|nr:MAG: hypothetical protein IPM65_02705 [Candidatus Roizmanbacteria bacterium]
MEFNKLVSLVLGFIVLILIFVWISNRVRQQSTVADGNNVTVTVTPTSTPSEAEERSGWNPFAFLFNNEEETPTPTPTKAGSMVEILSGTPTTTPVQIKVVESGSQTGTPNNGTKTITYVNTNNTKGGVNQIPETGAATLMLPLSLAAMTAGIYLRRK